MNILDNTKIKGIIDTCESRGSKVRVRDVAYVLLSRSMERQTAYQSLFMTADGWETYDRSADIQILRKVMDEKAAKDDIPLSSAVVVGKELTFEENRREMQRLLTETQTAYDNGMIEAKDAFKIMADIRVKLNDKFNVNEETGDRVIVVEKKYNAVCQHCHHEIFIPTKEDLMEEYGLVEKK